MLRAFAAGFIAAIGAAKLRKLHEDGKLAPLVSDLRAKGEKLATGIREGADKVAEQTASARQGIASFVRDKTGRAEASEEEGVSAPARAAPWPADKRAMPKRATAH